MKFTDIDNKKKLFETAVNYDHNGSNEEYHKQQDLMRSDASFMNKSFESVKMQQDQIRTRLKFIAKKEKQAFQRKAEEIVDFAQLYQTVYGESIIDLLRNSGLRSSDQYKQIVQTPEGKEFDLRIHKLDAIMDKTRRAKDTLNRKHKSIGSYKPWHPLRDLEL